MTNVDVRMVESKFSVSLPGVRISSIQLPKKKKNQKQGKTGLTRAVVIVNRPPSFTQYRSILLVAFSKPS